MVNTGWVGGGYGVGERISIKNTRSCIDAILDNSISNAMFNKDKIFGFDVPVELNNVCKEICNPREAWSDIKEYEINAIKLANMFKNNYEKYLDPNFTDYSKHGPLN